MFLESRVRSFCSVVMYDGVHKLAFNSKGQPCNLNEQSLISTSGMPYKTQVISVLFEASPGCCYAKEVFYSVPTRAFRVKYFACIFSRPKLKLCEELYLPFGFKCL